MENKHYLIWRLRKRGDPSIDLDIHNSKVFSTEKLEKKSSDFRVEYFPLWIKKDLFTFPNYVSKKLLKQISFMSKCFANRQTHQFNPHVYIFTGWCLNIWINVDIFLDTSLSSTDGIKNSVYKILNLFSIQKVMNDLYSLQYVYCIQFKKLNNYFTYKIL